MPTYAVNFTLKKFENTTVSGQADSPIAAWELYSSLGRYIPASERGEIAIYRDGRKMSGRELGSDCVRFLKGRYPPALGDALDHALSAARERSPIPLHNSLVGLRDAASVARLDSEETHYLCDTITRLGFTDLGE